MRNSVVLFLFSAMLVIPPKVWGDPCDGVNRNLTRDHATALASAIAKQLKMASVDVLQSFIVGNWSIIYVDTHESDEAFLFYKDNPLLNKYIALWSGAARFDEEEQIKGWVLKNAPGIPAQLANCFAWHVTKHRDL